MTLLDDFNDDMRQIISVIPQYEESTVLEFTPTFSKGIFQETALIHTKPAPTKVDMHETELYKVLELLEEIEDEAKKMNIKDYYFNHVVHYILQGSKTTRHYTTQF